MPILTTGKAFAGKNLPGVLAGIIHRISTKRLWFPAWNFLTHFSSKLLACPLRVTFQKHHLHLDALDVAKEI